MRPGAPFVAENQSLPGTPSSSSAFRSTACHGADEAFAPESAKCKIGPLSHAPSSASRSLARDFGRDLEDTGPTFVVANLTGGVLVVRFDHAAGLTTTDGAAPLAFELAGPDRVFHPATAVLDGNQVTVSAPDVPQPLYVRYAWYDSPPVNLVNSAGLPAVPFRTDRD